MKKLLLSFALILVSASPVFASQPLSCDSPAVVQSPAQFSVSSSGLSPSQPYIFTIDMNGKGAAGRHNVNISTDNSGFASVDLQVWSDSDRTARLSFTPASGGGLKSTCSTKILGSL